MIATPSTFAGPSGAEQVVRFRDPVRRFVGARVRNDALADDLTQEIFVRVLRRLPEVKDHRRVVGWIFQIARNVVVDHFRRSRPTTSAQETDGFDDSAHESMGAVEEERLRDELTAYVRGVVKTLPPIYREAILLTEYEGMTQVELARHLGIGLSTAKSRVQRGSRAGERARGEVLPRRIRRLRHAGGMQSPDRRRLWLRVTGASAGIRGWFS